MRARGNVTKFENKNGGGDILSSLMTCVTVVDEAQRISSTAPTGFHHGAARMTC